MALEIAPPGVAIAVPLRMQRLHHAACARREREFHRSPGVGNNRQTGGRRRRRATPRAQPRCAYRRSAGRARRRTSCGAAWGVSRWGGREASWRLRFRVRFRDDEHLAGKDDIGIVDLRPVRLDDRRVARRVAVVALAERPQCVTGGDSFVWTDSITGSAGEGADDCSALGRPGWRRRRGWAPLDSRMAYWRSRPRSRRPGRSHRRA